MVWCGFDPLMETGLVEYARGVVSAICSKAVKNRCTLDEQVVVENDQLYILSRALAEACRLPPHTPEQLRAEAFAGLVSFTRYIIPTSETRNITESGLRNYAESRAADLAQEIDKFDIVFEGLPTSQPHITRIVSAINNFLNPSKQKISS